jgi:hypothetical protein
MDTQVIQNGFSMENTAFPGAAQCSRGTARVKPAHCVRAAVGGQEA